MCEFCKEHGEGKVWYLQTKNYTHELLHEKLSPERKKIVKASTRFKWNKRFVKWFVVPASPLNTEPHHEEIDENNEENGEAHELQNPAEALMHSKITHFGQVIPLEDVEKVIESVDAVTRFPCGCRYLTTGKTDKRYCFGLGMDVRGMLNQFLDPASGLEYLSKEEAMKIIRDYDREGLMHSIWTGVTPYVMGLCNCDRDCGAYRDYIENDGLPSFFHAEYICQVNWDICNGCKSCMRQCQFGAMFYSSALAKVYINEKKCFGCGVCRSACPKGAISLLPRTENPEAAEIWLQKT